MRFLPILLVVLLSACQSTTPSLTSPYYAIPVGSKFVLHEPVTIPAGKASVYIQRGKIVPYNGRDTYYANCQFEVYTIRSTAYTVQPDEFVVNKVRSRIELNRYFEPGTLLAQMGGGRGDITSKYYARLFYLHSTKQPDVLRMTCGRWDYRAFSNQLTIDEIRGTLGGIFTVNLSVPIPG